MACSKSILQSERSSPTRNSLVNPAHYWNYFLPAAKLPRRDVSYLKPASFACLLVARLNLSVQHNGEKVLYIQVFFNERRQNYYVPCLVYKIYTRHGYVIIFNLLFNNASSTGPPL
jgi:hypothetical protein